MKGSPDFFAADEAPPFEVVNANGLCPLVINVDHASNRVPRRLAGLGVAAACLDTHIAWDAGAAQMALRLGELLDAPVILAGYSRLVIDCNRSPRSAASILAVSDQVDIPGNLNLRPEERELRRTMLFEPYHQALAHLLDQRGPDAALLAMHSFTPVLQDYQRPWQLGVCYGNDRRMAQIFLAELQALVGLTIGDNEPYTVEPDIDFSLPYHASARGLPHMMLEFSAATLNSAAAVDLWAARLADIWRRHHSSLSGQAQTRAPLPVL